MNRSKPAPAKRPFHLVRGDGSQDPLEAEKLDRFLLDPDPLLIASLRKEDQDRRRRKATWGLALVLGLAASVPFLWRLGPSHSPAGLTGKVASDQEKGLLLLDKGRKLLEEGRDDEALADFSLAVRRAPDLADAWADLGTGQSSNYQSELAERAYHRALTLEPGNRKALHGLGNLYLRRGEERKAEAAFAQGGLDQQLARLYLLQGKFRQAEVRLVPLRAESPDDELIYRMEEAARLGILDPALRSLLEPEPIGRTPWAELGWRLSKQKQYGAAAAAFAKSLAEIPDDVNALSGMGRSLLAQNRTAEARPYFERALGLDGDHVLSLDGLAYCLKNEGRVDEAIAVWQRLSQLYPGGKYGAPEGLAWTYYENRNYRQAAVYFARLVKINPHDSRVIDALNVAVQNLGFTSPR
ncbi:MAG TPA: tetratricopeptide repeat protein [Thermoanaerobaculia bacterium]